MAKSILVYASMTGNTRDMADAVEAGVKAAGHELVSKEVVDTDAAELAEYDGILLGAYTWGDGDLPDEFLDFYESMDALDLSGKKVAVFGSCDSSYEKYGAAVDTLIEKAKSLGADVVLEGLKVELSPSGDDVNTCKQFGQSFAELFLN